MPLLADTEKEIGRLTLALAEAEKRAERDYLRFVEADRKEIERLREENARLREERDLLHAILTNVSLSMEAFDVNAAIREIGDDDGKNN